MKTKKIHPVLEFNQSIWLKPFNAQKNAINLMHKKRIKGEKNGDKDGKLFYKLTKNAAYRKIMENIRNRNDLRL